MALQGTLRHAGISLLEPDGRQEPWAAANPSDVQTPAGAPPPGCGAASDQEVPVRARNARRLLLAAVLASAAHSAPARAGCAAASAVAPASLPQARHTVHCLIDRARAAHGLAA